MRSSTTLYRGAATTGSSTLYTAPPLMAVCVTDIAVTNPTAGALSATISLGGVVLFTSTIAANTTSYLTPNQIIYNAETITGLAGSTSVNFHIAGFEVY